MTDTEKASLNYYLTMLRSRILKVLIEQGKDMTPEIEKQYEKFIDEINDIMKINLIEGDK